jgi:hypothetical protein
MIVIKHEPVSLWDKDVYRLFPLPEPDVKAS